MKLDFIFILWYTNPMSHYTKFKKSKTPTTYSDRNMAWRKKGLCIKCGGTPEDGKRFCRPCLDKAGEYYHRRYAAMAPIDKCKARWKQIGNVKQLTGHVWTITPEDLTWPTHCPVLGIELDYTGKDYASSWSIDKFDPLKGYTPSNVNIISRLANTIKSNATGAQIRQVADWMEAQEK